jgi:hypothetical protein
MSRPLTGWREIYNRLLPQKLLLGRRQTPEPKTLLLANPVAKVQKDF